MGATPVFIFMWYTGRGVCEAHAHKARSPHKARRPCGPALCGPALCVSTKFDSHVG